MTRLGARRPWAPPVSAVMLVGVLASCSDANSHGTDASVERGGGHALETTSTPRGASAPSSGAAADIPEVDLEAVVNDAVAGRPSYVAGDSDAVHVIIPNPGADLRQILDELGFDDDAFTTMTRVLPEGVERRLSSPCCDAAWRWHGDDGLLLDLSTR